MILRSHSNNPSIVVIEKKDDIKFKLMIAYYGGYSMRPYIFKVDGVDEL